MIESHQPVLVAEKQVLLQHQLPKQLLPYHVHVIYDPLLIFNKPLEKIACCSNIHFFFAMHILLFSPFVYDLYDY